MVCTCLSTGWSAILVLGRGWHSNCFGRRCLVKRAVEIASGAGPENDIGPKGHTRREAGPQSRASPEEIGQLPKPLKRDIPVNFVQHWYVQSLELTGTLRCGSPLHPPGIERGGADPNGQSSPQGHRSSGSQVQGIVRSPPFDKGIPVARPVRKARGLSETARLPKGLLLASASSAPTSR